MRPLLIGRTIPKSFGDGARVVGVVDGIGRVRPEIEYVVPEFAHFVDDASFDRKPCVGGCNSNFHAVFNHSAHASPASVIGFTDGPNAGKSPWLGSRIAIPPR
jgi:hypothetical protein